MNTQAQTSFLLSQADVDAAPDPGTVRTARVGGLCLDWVPLEVVHHSPGLLAVNKPADVRLDGPFDLTLEKLLAARVVAPLLPEPGRVWEKAHQLDFATSGVMALTGSAALATATQTLFDRRLTKKQYLAVVHGHVVAPPARRGVTPLADDECLDTFASTSSMKVKGGAPAAASSSADAPAASSGAVVLRSRAVAPVRTAMVWYREAAALYAKLAAADTAGGGDAIDGSESKELSGLLALGWRDFKTAAAAARAALGDAAPPFPIVGSLAAAFAAEPPASGLDAPVYLAAQLPGLLASLTGDDLAAAGVAASTGFAAAPKPSSPLGPQLPLSVRLFDLCTAAEAVDTARYRVEQAAAAASKAAEKDAAAAAAAAAAASSLCGAGSPSAAAASGGAGCSADADAAAAAPSPAASEAAGAGPAAGAAGALTDFGIAPATESPLPPSALAALRKPRFFVDLPVADLPGDFRMGIEGEHVGARDGRPAQTLVQVLGHGYWAVPAALLEGSRAAVAAVHGGSAAVAGAGAAASPIAGAAAAGSSSSSNSSSAGADTRLVYQPVTKLLLQPITGRRHQLRIHLRACAYAIVGDVTYAKADHDKPRMMLHAWRLLLQYPVKKPAGGGVGGGGRGKERGRGGGRPSSKADAAAAAGASAMAADEVAVSGGAGTSATSSPAEAAASASAAAADSPPAAAAAGGAGASKDGNGKQHVPSGPVGIESPDPFTPAALAALVRECGIAMAPAGAPSVVAADAASWPQEAGLLLAGDAAKPAGELVPPLHS